MPTAAGGRRAGSRRPFARRAGPPAAVSEAAAARPEAAGGPGAALGGLREDEVRACVVAALAEDTGALGDVTALATVGPEVEATAEFLAKADGVLAGTRVVERVCASVDGAVACSWRKADGDAVRRGETLGSLRGPARSVLLAERTALNFLQRMSGIATATARMVAAAEGTGARILETRKTAPGLRAVDKWAVRIGGGTNHRLGLYDMLLIKDNHVAAAGGVTAALDAALAYLAAQGLELEIEVETRTLDEVDEVVAFLAARPAAAGRLTRIMLDNMVAPAEGGGGYDVGALEAALARLRGSGLKTEASGNVNLESVGLIARTGVDFISAGALTHSVEALDISLNIVVDAA